MRIDKVDISKNIEGFTVVCHINANRISAKSSNLKHAVQMAMNRCLETQERLLLSQTEREKEE